MINDTNNCSAFLPLSSVVYLCVVYKLYCLTLYSLVIALNDIEVVNTDMDNTRVNIIRDNGSFIVHAEPFLCKKKELWRHLQSSGCV